MSRNKCTRSGSKLMIATLVFAQMLSGLAPLFTFSVRAEGITEPTQTVQELSPTPTETPLPTDSPVPTVEPSVLPEVTVEPSTVPTGSPVPTDVVEPTVLPESGFTPTPNITINPNEQVCTTNGSVRNTINSEWSFNSATGVAETKSKVELGVTYVFPLDSKVTVTFNCLPKDESLRTTLRIERMAVSELNLPEGVNPSSDFAYDITTGMNDGVFKYDVTLPKPVGTDAEVSYMENVGSQLVKIEDSKLDQSSESVKANDLDHFTIFVVSTTVRLSGTVNGLSQVTVSPNGLITISVNGTISGDDWLSTRYEFENLGTICINTPDHTANGNYTEEFTVNAPSSNGTYDLNIRTYEGNNCSGTHSNTWTLSNAVIVSTPLIVNPNLTQACGLDIALVLDTSYSIDDGELTQMRNAFKAMVDSLVGTPTQFSVSRFSDTASVLQAFTSDTTLVKSKIDSADGGTYTNWQDGLTKAWGTFGGRADKPNLVIFASDGNPNRTGISGTDVSESQAVSDAMIIANTIKTSGTRILGLGIGSDLNTANMSAITGPNVNTGNVTTSDVITTDFATMAVQLSNFAKQTCGGKISVNKYVDGVQKSDGQTWSFQIDGGTAITTDANGQVASGTLTIGNHSITEVSIPSGYTFDHATCTNGTPSVNGVTGIALTADSIITCNFYNTTNKGSITLVKNTVGGNGTFTFNTTGGLSPASPSITTIGNTGSTLFSNLVSGTYSIAENVPSDWDLTSATCSDGSPVTAISLQKGENVTCTFTNTLKLGHLNVIKHVVNNNGGTKVASNFAITVTGNGPAPSSFNGVESPGTNVQLLAGSYSVTEGSHTGYSVNYSSDCSGSITPGQTKTCTITNDDLPGTLTVVKNLNNDSGGDAVESDFSFKVTDGDNVTKEYQFEADGSNDISVNSGTFNIVENSADGYTTTYSNCSNVAITNGGSATCTITNNDIAPKLTLVKLISKDNGGNAEATDWTLKASSVDYGYFEGSTPVSSDIRAGVAYTLSEHSGPDGYSASDWSCTGGSLIGDQLTLSLGDDVTCTITNDDLQGTLIVRKVVTNNDGGQKTADDFSFNYNSSGSISFEADGENEITVNSGYYTVTESADDGYTTTYDNCEEIFVPNDGTATCTITNDDKAAKLIVKKVVNNNFGGELGFTDFSFQVGTDSPINFEADGTNELTVDAGTYTVTEPAVAGYHTDYSGCEDIEIANGGNATCTITNSDIAPKLTLVKQIVNNNNGQAEADDWTLTASSDNSPVIYGATPISSNVLAGKTYVLSESGPSGYTASDWVCNGGSLEGNELELGLADDVTCTITNNDQPGTLIVQKVVKNDNGGGKNADDFSFRIGSTGPIQFEADGENQIHLNSGTYTVTEVSDNGYTTTYDNCTNVIVPNGESATCTITNDDKPGTLIVKKTLIKNNGGDDSKDDFSFTYTGSGTVNFEADGENRITVSAGKYTVTENPYFGYAVSYSNCTDINVPNGGSATCTITNNDIQPKLKVIKVVVNDNGGTKLVSDFPLYVNTTRVNSGAVNGFNAGWKKVSEIGEYGYNATFSGDCRSDGWIELNIGKEKTCTITNDDIQPVLIVKKFVDNDFGGTLHSADFTLHTDNVASHTTIETFNGSQSGKSLGLNAGVYRVWEDSETGYEMTENCGTHDNGIIELKVGDVKTCIVKNHDIQPKLKVIKNVINNDGGDKHAYDFWITVDGSHAFPFLFWGRESGTNVGLHAGEFDVKEFVSSQYAVNYSEDCSGTIEIGEEKTCTITNDDIAPLLKIVKTVVNDNGGTLGVSDFSFNVDGNDVSTNVTDNTFITLRAGMHYAGETEIYGYEASDWGRDCRWDGKVYLHPGDVKTCTITNDDIAPKLKVLNFNDQDGNGVWGDGSTLDQPIFDNQFQLLGTDNSIIKNTDVNGEIDFIDFVPGNYQLINNLWTNWIYTNISCSNEQSINDLNIQIGDEVTCTFGQQSSALLIAKNKPVSEPSEYRVGDLVNFIINVEVPNEVSVLGHEEKYNSASMQNVVVTDIPSKGFTYSATSTNYPDSIVNQNGLWNLGSIARGGSEDLYFSTIVGSTIDPGDYKDLAWAKGQLGDIEIEPSEDLFRVAANDGYDPITILALDEPTQTTHFVGLASNVIEDPETPEQGVVLGEKTVRLPRTGSESLDLLLIAITITALGASALVMSILMERKQKVFTAGSNSNGKLKMKKNFLKFSAFLGISMLFLAFGGIFNPIHAQDLQTLKIEQPESPTNKTAIEVTYVAYDLSGAVLNVKCSVQKLPAGAVNAVASNDATASSGTCLISNSLISENGDYKITAFNDVSGGKSASVNVTVDRVNPPTPVVYNKVSPETCKNRIDFTTGIDSDATPTVKVDIFRGESTNFIAGPLTLLESVIVGPGISSSSTVYALPDCNKTYYYAIQAVDSIGNRSGFVGDIGINVVYYITTTPTPTGTNTNGGTTGNVTPTPGTTGGPNGGVDTDSNNGLVEGATDNTDQTAMNNNLLIIFIVIGVIVLAGFIFEIKLNKEPGK